MKSTLPFVLMFSVLLGSCSPGTTGMFAGLETETKLVASGALKLNATISSMAEDSTNFYAAGGLHLYVRANTDLGTKVDWTSESIHSQAQTLAVRSIGNSEVYAIAGDGTTNTLYHRSGGAWAAVSLSGTDNPVDLVPVIGGDGSSVTHILVVTETAPGSQYYNSVYLLTSTTLTSPLLLTTSAGPSNLPVPVTSAASDGTSIFMVNKSFVWATDLTLSSAALVTGVPQGKDYSSILVVSGSTTSLDGVYLATRDLGTSGGNVYFWTSAKITGTAWQTPATVVSSASSSSTAVCFLSLLLPTSTSPCVLVGTRNHGYSELTPTKFAAVPTLTTVTGNYDVSTLPTSVVTFLYATADGTTVCLGTNSLGLWTQGSDKTWKQQ